MKIEVKEIIHLKATNGKAYSPFGVPRGVELTGERVSVGFALYDPKSNTTFGIRRATREECQERADAENVRREEYRAALAA